MRNENTGRKVSKTVGHRKKLSDITNTPILQKSRAYEENDQLLNESSAQLQDELANVKKMLADKEECIEDYKRCMEKMWINYCRKTKQNDEVILHNSQLFKDLTQARDKLKIIEHENAQMSALYKICKVEMQQKLNEALEQVDHLTKLLETLRSKKAPADEHSPVNSEDFHNKHGLSCEVPDEDFLSIHDRSTLRKRNRKIYKEPSLRQKMRQGDENITRSRGSIQCDDNGVVQEPGKDEECKSVSTTCRTEIKTSQGVACSNMEGGNRAHTEAAEQYTVKRSVSEDQGAQLPDTFCVTTRKSCERLRRRTASCVGSYKEPPLNTKMRRAA